MRKHLLDFAAHQFAGVCAGTVLHQQLVITRVFMADVRNHRQPQRLWIEFFRRRRTSDATGTFPARPRGDANRLLWRTAGKVHFQPFGDRRLIFVILDLPPGRCPCALLSAALLVGETFRLRSVDGLRRDENALPLVTFPGA